MAKAKDNPTNCTPTSKSDPVKEMNELYNTNGGGDKAGSDGKVGGVKSSKSGSEVKRIPIVEVKFNYKPKFDKDEYERQLNNQSKGMCKLTVAEYLENRERYNREGRAKEGNAAQKAARKQALSDKIAEYRKKTIYDRKKAEYRKMTYNEAKTEAEKWLKTQAALHDPDQIAGGNPLNITGMGDKGVNSSIGSQWKKNVKIIDEHVEKYAKNMTEEEKKNTFLNVKLVF